MAPLRCLAIALLLAAPAWAQQDWPDGFFAEERWRANDSQGAEPGLYLFVCARGAGPDADGAKAAALAEVRRRAGEKRGQLLAEAQLGPGALRPTEPARREFLRDDAWLVRRAGGRFEAFVRAGYPEGWVRPHLRLVDLQQAWPAAEAGRAAWFARAEALVEAYEAEGEVALAALSAEQAAGKDGAPTALYGRAADLHDRQRRPDDARRLLEKGLARPGLAPSDALELGLRLSALHEARGPKQVDCLQAARRALEEHVVPVVPADHPDRPRVAARLQELGRRLAELEASWERLVQELQAWVKARAQPRAAFHVTHQLRGRRLELQAHGAEGRAVAWLWLDQDGLYRYHVLDPEQRGVLLTPELGPGAQAYLVAIALPAGARPAWLTGPEEIAARRQVDAKDLAAVGAFRAVLAGDQLWAVGFDVQAP